MLGEALRELRDSKHLSVRELSEKCGVSKSAIVNLEQGRFSPRIEIVQKILNTLDAALVIKTL